MSRALDEFVYAFGDNAAAAVGPAALSIVDAVRLDDHELLLSAVARAEQVGGPYWRMALIIALAAMVPDDKTICQLTAWMHPDDLAAAS